MAYDLTPQLKDLPRKPGVYLFRDEKGALLYVGKAKNLKSRVRSYFEYNRVGAGLASARSRTEVNLAPVRLVSLLPSKDLSPAKQLMVSSIRTIETIIVSNETEALLLEAGLIKRHHPPYNIVLADDKSYVYIKFDFDRVYPDVYPIRRPYPLRRSRALLFGPYPSATAAYTVLRLAKKIFPYCLKPPTTLHPRQPRPCLNWHLKRCPGPCTGVMTPQKYEGILRRMIPLFQGKYTDMVKTLSASMRHAAERKNFETAAIIRDQIAALRAVAVKQNIVDTRGESYDVMSLARSDTVSCVNCFRVREGVLTERLTLPLLQTKDVALAELLQTFLDQYYAYTADIPTIVYTPFPVSSPLPDCLTVTVPQRGRKRQLLLLGCENAKEELKRFITMHNLKTSKTADALILLQELLKLPFPPARIEAFDISNIQGSHAVGAMTVLMQGALVPREYRNFTIRTVKKSNDVAMLQELLRRRFAHSLLPSAKAHPNDFREDKAHDILIAAERNSSKVRVWPLPDLIVIDGGKPQLATTCRVLEEFNMNIPILGIAKGRGLSPRQRKERGEEVWYRQPRTIDKNKVETRIDERHNSAIKLFLPLPTLHFIDRVRNEAHRFGIAHYRAAHRRALTSTQFDLIPYIGPSTQRTLLKEFGSLTEVRRADFRALAALIGEKKAEILIKRLSTIDAHTKVW